MELSEYLLETYGYNEPIMLNEISFKNYSRPWINKELAKLCEAGKLLRFGKGIYSENAAVQSFLELMNSVTSGFFDDKKRKITSEFSEENKITRSAITKYACVFPDKAMRTLIESEIIYDVTKG